MRVWDKSKPPLGPFTLNKDAPQAQGLVAWYPMGGIGRLWVPDYLGDAHLTLGTQPTPIVGQSGAPGLSFVSASSQYSEGVITAATALPLTMAAWVSTANAAVDIPMCIGTNGSNARIQIQKDNATRKIGVASVDAADTGNTVLFTTASYTDNVEFHAAAVCTSSTRRQAFLNGVGSAVDTVAVSISGMNRVLLGARRNSAGVGVFWGGQIGEACVWNVALSVAEVANLADPGSRFELWYPLRNRKWFSAGGGSYTPAQSEALSLVDAVSLVAGFSASSSEALTLLDSSSVVANLGVTVSESLSLAELLDVKVGFAVSHTSGLVLVDSLSVLTNFTSSASEAMSLSDSRSIVASLSASVSEAMTLTDPNSASAAGDYSVSITESLSLIDSLSNLAALGVGISEALALADSESCVAALSASSSDAMALSDATNGSASGDFTASTSESLSLGDASSTQAALTVALVEALSLDDGASEAWGFYVSLVEGLSFAEAASAFLDLTDELYPLAGLSQGFPLTGQSGVFPLAGQDELYPLEGLI